MTRPEVLFVCVKNGGKSQMAAALLRWYAGEQVLVRSAGTAPSGALNAESVAALEEVGVTTDGEQPKAIEPAWLDSADRVVLLGTEAVLTTPGRSPVEQWDTDEPSARGITGTERMRLVRDDIDTRVQTLLAELLPPA